MVHFYAWDKSLTNQYINNNMETSRQIKHKHLCWIKVLGYGYLLKEFLLQHNIYLPITYWMYVLITQMILYTPIESIE